jgi:hypothetical protein
VTQLDIVSARGASPGGLKDRLPRPETAFATAKVLEAAENMQAVEQGPLSSMVERARSTLRTPRLLQIDSRSRYSPSLATVGRVAKFYRLAAA